MSLTWYKTRPSWSSRRIEPVTIDKFTAMSVIIGGRAARRMTQYECFFPTWDDAKAFIVKEAENSVEYAKTSLARAQSALDVARKITAEPEAK